MIGSFRRGLGSLARATFAKLKKPGSRLKPPKGSVWRSYLTRIYQPGWRKFLLATSMVAPMYSEGESNIGGMKFTRETIKQLRKDSPMVSPRHQESASTKMSQLMFKFFGSKCVGLAHLGMFAAAHIPGEQRAPFRNLNDIFNLGDEESEVKEAVGPMGKSCFSEKYEETSSEETVAAKEEKKETPISSSDVAYFEAKVTNGGVLVLRSEDIAPGRWEALSSYLKDTPSIKVLRLQGVEITTKELKIIGASLKEIRHITFCDNSIGLNQGAFDVLCATLLCCSFLESTSIVRNSLDDGHVGQIVNLISKHNSMKELSLCWNGIGDTGAMQLAKALQDMSRAMTLKLLDLSYNCIGDIGRQHLRSCSDKYW
eukprot:CAMPEP_0170174956 /NCGR_PEP_ID=MMETSP0040_2-20121228/8120_1 /TAXON_ID=641309 /ORGANISM="Lotharella oceanica, Strain CCMP622" /LENGTH=369 /DNA_ID=CAMNT_0010416789 /DNA_START=89 /DNA_END=1195 /DNA_ORIENTATION=-